MKFIDIVDKDGNPTGEIVERNTLHDLKLPHFEVIIFVVNNKKQVLLQKRSENKRYYPGKYALCGGLVISKESCNDAAIRELKEEIGIDVKDSDLNILEENLDLTRIYYVLCNKKEDEFKIQKEELSLVKWVDIDDVINMVENNDDKVVIKKERLYLLRKLKDFIV